MRIELLRDVDKISSQGKKISSARPSLYLFPRLCMPMMYAFADFHPKFVVVKKNKNIKISVFQCNTTYMGIAKSCCLEFYSFFSIKTKII